MRILVSAAIFFLFSLSSFAFDFKVNDLYFDIESRENHLVSFSGCASDIEDLTVPYTITVDNVEWYVNSIKNQAVRSSSLRTLNVSLGIETIGDFAFSRCTNLKKVNLPFSLKSIGAYAFAHCNISDLNIASSGAPQLEIGYHAFDDNKLSILHLDNVSIVRDNAFEGNRFLTTVYLSHCYYIGKDAFNYDYAINNIICYDRTPANLAGPAFPANVEHFATVHIPYGSIDSYRSSGNWSEFGDNFQQTDNFSNYDSYCMMYEYSNDKVDLQPYLLINGETHNQWPSDIYHSPGPYVKPGDSVTFTILPVPGYKLVYASFSDADVYAEDVLNDFLRDGFYKVDNVTSSIAVNLSFDVDDSGIDDINFSYESTPILFINTLGIVSDKPFKGVNIVKYSNGETKKIVY